MSIAQTRMKCMLCGYAMPPPGPAGIGEEHPKHCGADMVLERDLKCDTCGFATSDVFRFDSLPIAAAGPAPAEPRVTLRKQVVPPPAAGPRATVRKRVALTPETVTQLAGKTWGRYRVVAQLGRGGMAIVYKAYQPSLSRHVAIKFMLPQTLSEPTMIKRFKQEAKLIANLRHPNIVTVLDFGERRGVAYIVMEFVEGETLRAKLGAPMALKKAVGIAAQVGRALDCAHKQGVVHRDVKPSNILLAREDWALLSDFGIAKVMQSTQQLTATGMFMGTPEYMAPEQGQGSKVDARCDIYALGIVLFEMLTGRPPFTADTPFAVLMKHYTEPLPPPRTFNPAIGEEIENITLKAAAKDPAERFASAGEMVAALEACV